jgi:hypothetical protein
VTSGSGCVSGRPKNIRIRSATLLETDRSGSTIHLLRGGLELTLHGRELCLLLLELRLQGEQVAVHLQAIQYIMFLFLIKKLKF